MIRRVGSVQEYFDTLPERFVESASKGVDAVYQFEISGPDGGTWHVIVKNEQLEIKTGAHGSPTACIQSSAANYLKICNGDINGMRAVMTRKMKVHGNINVARKMQYMFPTGNI